jgi:integrase/recombinase XerC
MNDLVVAVPLGPTSPASDVALFGDLYQAVLSGRKAQTLRAYQGDYADFAAFLGAESPAAGLGILVAFPKHLANASVLAYRAHLFDRKLSAATIGRRLAALRSAVKVARLLGKVDWSLEVEGPKAEAYRDTSGPGREGWLSVLASAKAAATTPKGRRDLALVRLLHDLGLRRSEPIALDLADVDLVRSTVQVLGKGKTAKLPMTIAPQTRAAIADWIATRGDWPGPLFHRLDRGSDQARLTADGVYKIVVALGLTAKLSRHLRPHGLRHEAITHALDVTGGDVRAVRKFSRHSKLDTLIVYDDARRDMAGDVARKIADD